MTTNGIVCVGEYALKRKAFYWLTQTIIAHGLGSAGGRGKLAQERKTFALALASPSLHWQVLGQTRKLGRVSCSVNPALVVISFGLDFN